MATTSTTKTIKLRDGTLYAPNIVRTHNLTNLASGTTNNVVIETAKYRAARLSIHVAALAAGSTLSFYIATGPTTSLFRNVKSSSGAVSVTKATTGTDWHVWAGLDRYSNVAISEAGGTGASTGISIDVELV